MISTLLICAQHEIRLILFDLQFHSIRRILEVKVITATDLVSTDCCRGHAEPIRNNMFWRRNCKIQSLQLSEMGLAYVDSNTSDAGEILSGSYPLLNKIISFGQILLSRLMDHAFR